MDGEAVELAVALSGGGGAAADEAPVPLTLGELRRYARKYPWLQTTNAGLLSGVLG